MPLTRKLSLCVLALVIAVLPFASALATTPEGYIPSHPEALQAEQIYSEYALLIDQDTGEVLLSKNSKVRLYPASTTKIMTLLLALESGIPLDKKVTVPQEAAKVAEGSSVIPVKPGDVLSFGDLLYGFMLSSGNDGANAIAVLVSGSIDAFVARMNGRAAELGCEGTHFNNAHGIHNEDHYTTAQDLALISQAGMKNAVFRDIVSRGSFNITIQRNGVSSVSSIINRNMLLLSDSQYYYPDCTGIKTGHTNRAGWCFVGSAERDGMRLICVAMNCEKEDQKWYDAVRMFEYGFTRYTPVSADTLLTRAAYTFNHVKIEGASEDDSEGGELLLNLSRIEGGSATQMVVSSNEGYYNATQRMLSGLTVEWTRSLTAPVRQGEQMGVARFSMTDGTPVSAVLTASRDVEAQPEPEVTATATATASATAAPDIPAKKGASGGAGVIVALALLLMLALGALAFLHIQKEKKRRQAARRRAARRRKAQAEKKRQAPEEIK